MIVRIWRAVATADGADAYRRYFERSVVPELATVTGHRMAYLLERSLDGRVELSVLSLWDSLEAITRFAGPDPGVAVVHDEARALLEDYDSVVEHHTVTAEAAADTGPGT